MQIRHNSVNLKGRKKTDPGYDLWAISYDPWHLSYSPGVKTNGRDSRLGNVISYDSNVTYDILV